MCQEDGLCVNISLSAGHCAYLHSTGDVNLAEDQVRGNHNPGAGGWPTIKYFNKETGYQGGTYVKKDAGAAMCDELGKVENMEVRQQLSLEIRGARQVPRS